MRWCGGVVGSCWRRLRRCRREHPLLRRVGRRPRATRHRRGAAMTAQEDARIIAIPHPRGPIHDLPSPMPSPGGWLPENTIARCPHCGRVFVVRIAGDHYGSHVWTRLRWYHRAARRLLVEVAP